MNARCQARGSWTICALLTGYTAFLYLGLGPAPDSMSPAAWEPSGFLREVGFVESLFEHPLVAIAGLSAIPAAGAAVVLLGPSALAAAVACSCFVTSLIFSFYGLTGALRVWSFFGWRGSWVILISGIAVGVALSAPLLAARGWRLPVAIRWLVYTPICFATIALIRNVTGTDERLPFNLSPWPAIDVLALEIAVYSIVGVMIGGAVGAGLCAKLVDRPVLRAASVACASLLPVLWFVARFDHTGPRALLVGLAISLAIVTAIVRIGVTSERELESRAGSLALAAALVALPIMAGSSLAEGDHAVSRHVRARAIIDALADHYDEHEAYPDELQELIDEGRLEQLPAPRVGFAVFPAIGWTEAPAFRFQNLGSSYLLEFASTEWVMCSYSPAWRGLDDEEEEFEDEGASADRTPIEQAADCREDCGRVCGQDCDPDRVADCAAFCSAACDDECAREIDEDARAPDPSVEAWACPAGRPELW